MSRKSAYVLMLILLTSAAAMLLFDLPGSVAPADQATFRIQNANAAVNQAFNEVWEAEKAGVNVDTLLNQLSHTATLLANAENAYRAGNFSISISYANAVLPITQQVLLAAQTQKQAALDSNQIMFPLTAFTSVLASIILVVVLLFVWKWLKSRYIKRIYESKPELVENEAL